MKKIIQLFKENIGAIIAGAIIFPTTYIVAANLVPATSSYSANNSYDNTLKKPSHLTRHKDNTQNKTRVSIKNISNPMGVGIFDLDF